MEQYSDSTFQTVAYAAYNMSDDIRKISSSGGLFYILAKYTIERKGIVFGAGFDEHGEVVHCSCDNEDGLSNLMRSKYVQSRIGDQYCEVKKSLEQKRMVLFCGTPCQVGGLLSYLEIKISKKYIDEYLITLDFICHGVSSRRVWRDYLTRVSAERKVTSVNFRDKEYGWKKYALRIRFDDGHEYINSLHTDIFLEGFMKNLYLRPSCYNCAFKGINRRSDFTLGDFWGGEMSHPEMFDDMGTSIVLLNSKKGLHIFNEVKKDLRICQIDIETIERTNPMLIRSVKYNAKRRRFFSRYQDDKVLELISANIKPSIMKEIKKRALSSLIRVRDCLR